MSTPFESSPAPPGRSRIINPEVYPEVAPLNTVIDETTPMPSTPEPEELPTIKRDSKKSRRLNLDSIGMLVFSLLIVSSLMATSFIASFNAIYASAEFTGTAVEWRWVFPVFIDVAIFGYTLNLFIFKRRGAAVGRTIAGLIFFAFISVAVNFAHTLDYWQGDLANYQAWVGVMLAVAAPIAVLLASEELGRLAFEDGEIE